LDAILVNIFDIFRKPEVQENLKETARIYFTSNDVTINLVWSIIILGLLGLVLKPLFGIPLLTNIFDAMSHGGASGAAYGGGVSDGYGAPSGGYGAPSGGYGAPDAGYGAPDAGYGAPDAGYGAPSSGYDTPNSGYDAPAGDSGFNPGSSYSAPSTGYNGRYKRDVWTEDMREVFKNLMDAPLESILLKSISVNNKIAELPQAVEQQRAFAFTPLLQ